MTKKNTYRLRVLLEMRERAKDEAEQFLGQKNKELKDEQYKLKELELELERMIQKRESKKREYAEKAMKGELSAQGVVSSNVYIDRLKESEGLQEEAIDNQMRMVMLKKEEVEEARLALVKASQELKALEKHKENWEKERKLALQRKQEDIQDDIAQTIFRRNQGQ